MNIEPIRWTQNRLFLLDQRLLPEKERYVECKTYQDTVHAIQAMVVRGAPAIGIAAAFGIALGAQSIPERTREEFFHRLEKVCRIMGAARPTAVNLFWAIERMKRRAAASDGLSIPVIRRRLVQEARAILAEDIESNRRIGRYGHRFLKNGATVLTHCNAGALATGGYGTALGVIRAARESGKTIFVIADETRPFLQGARLTAWELKKDGIPVTVITDSMAGSLMQQGRIDAVIVGADRIAANGDTANKIGTYALALLARAHRIPLYVAAPLSTIDFSTSTGKEIPIECRSADEVTHIRGKRMVPGGVPVWNPAFDVTPGAYIAAIITDRGVAEKPYRRTLKRLVSK